MKSASALAALCLAAGVAVAAAGPVTPPGDARGRDLAATCAGCHGTDGRSVGGFAPIAGIPREALLQGLRAFRAGERPATVMRQLALGYTDEELGLIADYFAARAPEGAAR